MPAGVGPGVLSLTMLFDYPRKFALNLQPGVILPPWRIEVSADLAHPGEHLFQVSE